MSIEDEECEIDSSAYEAFKRLMEYFDSGYRLFEDSMNVWNPIIKLHQVNQDFLEQLQPVEHYEDYFSTRQPVEIYELIMERSKPEAVVEFNDLVDEWNSDVARIKREKDYAMINSFERRARELIYSKQ